jgi:hypothetical protein
LIEVRLTTSQARGMEEVETGSWSKKQRFLPSSGVDPSTLSIGCGF